MYLCYIDESGTADIPGTTSHFVLAGLAMPVQNWKRHNSQVERIKRRYGLEQAEIHVAWLMRPYIEQRGIPNFSLLAEAERRSRVQSARTEELLRLQRVNQKLYKQTRKNYKNTDSYIHLTFEERRQVVVDLATCISRWGNARLFAECINKVHFDPVLAGMNVAEQAFEQVVSRFEQFLERSGEDYGLLIHDNNETMAKKHTAMMKHFLQRGTLWTSVRHIIETPMFVDSQLTSMVQMADIAGYALRRYLENGETEFFDLVFQRADRRSTTTVGVRHFTEPVCDCKICSVHRPAVPSR